MSSLRTDTKWASTGHASALPNIRTSLQHISALHIALGCVAILALAVLIAPDRYIFNARRKGIREVPGGWPILGHASTLLALSSKRQNMLSLTVELQRTVGKGGMPFAASMPALGGRLTWINNPLYIKHVQKTNFDNYIKGPDFARTMSDVMGPHGIFVADGDVWRKQRKLASNIFSVGNFRTHVQSAIQRDLGTLNQLLADAANKKTDVDLPDLFFRFTLSSFSLMAFSADVGALPREVEGLQVVNSFARNFDYAQRIMQERFYDPLASITELVSPQGRKMRRTIKELHEYCFNTIDLRMQSRQRGDSQAAAGKGGKDLLDLFVDQGVQREDLLPVVLNFLIAGRDTAAQQLAWFFYELYKHPECIENCRREIHEKLGSGASYRPMSYDDLGTLVYTQASLYEALRLHPSVPKNLKKAVKDDVIRPYAQPPDGSEKAPNAVEVEKLPDVVIKAGESVIFSDYAMARMPEIWGPDCEEFKPERFIEDGKFKSYSQYLFHAFNAGPRLCLGQTLATYEACAVVCELLAHYNVIFDDARMKADPPMFDESLTLPVRNPYKVRFEKRND